MVPLLHAAIGLLPSSAVDVYNSTPQPARRAHSGVVRAHYALASGAAVPAPPGYPMAADWPACPWRFARDRHVLQFDAHLAPLSPRQTGLINPETLDLLADQLWG